VNPSGSTRHRHQHDRCDPARAWGAAPAVVSRGWLALDRHRATRRRGVTVSAPTVVGTESLARYVLSVEPCKECEHDDACNGDRGRSDVPISTQQSEIRSSDEVGG
jgi:hypothetical protein